jgi:hypothetical protein
MTETEWSFFRLLPMDLTSVMSAGVLCHGRDVHPDVGYVYNDRNTKESDVWFLCKRSKFEENLE